jgi:molybdenum cofactor biosynthesis protein B
MASPSSDAHRLAAREQTAGCAVLTVSDTRTPEPDSGGDVIVDTLRAARHAIVARAIVRDEPPAIDAQIRAWIADPAIQAVLTTGGTGIARRDTTIEVVRALIERPIPGFGELFRMLSYEEVGAAAMLSRALAGLAGTGSSGSTVSSGSTMSAGSTVIFCMPGSPNAVRLAMDRLIIPELPHLLWERGR